MDKKELDKQEICNTIVYTIRWNAVKSARLKRIRGVSFEEIIHAEFLGTQDHPTRDNQRILVCEFKGYVWLVPYVYEENGIFLKTIYPSRKYRKLYKRGEKNEEI